MNKLWFSLIIILLSSCVMDKGKISVSGLSSQILGAKTQMDKVQVTAVSIVNNQLVISGSELSHAKKITISSENFSEDFSIESISSSQIIANGLKNISFKVGALFNLVISDSYGAATFSVTFELQDGAVTAAKIHHMGAQVGQVLKFNGTNWEPGDLNSLTFAGNWDANLNSPDLSAGGSLGEFYIVNSAGVFDLSGGPGTNSWALGDWVVWNNIQSRWEKIDNATNVKSFNGRVGVVLPVAGDYDLAGLSDVDTTGASAGKILKYDGTKWVVADDLSSGGAGSVSSAEIADGSITDADINASANIAQSKISNLTSDLAGKLSLTGGTLSGALDMGGNNIGNVGTVDGVDVSALSTSVSTNTANISAIDKTSLGLGNVDNVQQMPLSYLNTATGLGTSNVLVPSQNAVKAYVDNSIVWAKSASNIYYNTGNVGIGVIPGSYKLEVSGNTKTTGLFIGNRTFSSPTSTADATFSLGGSIFGRSQINSYDGGGWANMYLGAGAGSSSSTGTMNIGLGSHSLSSLTSASGNLGFGYRTLNAVTTGANNIAIGRETAKSITTGSGNIVIGGGFGTTLTTGSNNIFIGNNINAAASSDSSKLNIGNTIHGDLAAGLIGIGTNSPTETLTVNGSIKVTSCPSGMTNYGGWCMENADNATATRGAALNGCAAKGMQLCSFDAYFACDAANGATCTWNDVAGETRWAAGLCGDLSAGLSWHDRFCAAKGDNTIVVGTNTDSYQYRCCKMLP